MNTDFTHTETHFFNKALRISGFVVVILSLFRLISHLIILSSHMELGQQNIAMAADSAFIFLCFGFFLLYEGKFWPVNSIRIVLTCLTGILVVYVWIKFFKELIYIDLIPANLLLPITKMINSGPVYRESAIADFLFGLSGIAILIKLIGKQGGINKKLINFTGALVGIVGLIFFLGYLFATPIIYGDLIIPVAISTSVGFIFLGLGLSIIADEESTIYKSFNPAIPRGRLMRHIMPLVAGAIVIQGVFQVIIEKNADNNIAIIAALYTIVICLVIAFVIIRTSKVIFTNAERLEQLQQSMQNQLRESEEKFRSAFLASPDALCINRFSDGLYVEFNENFSSLSGYSDNDLANKTIMDLNIWANQKDRKFFLHEIHQKGQVRNMEAFFKTKDGALLSGLISARILTINNVSHVLSVVRDIHEIKEVREQLILEKQRLRILIDNIPDRVFFKDRASRFIIANIGVAKHIGVSSPSEIIGKSDFDFYPGDHASQYMEDEQALMEKGTPLLNHEEPARESSGDIGWTITSKIPIKDSAGQVIGLVGLSRDITARKNFEQQLILAKEEAEKANQLKDYFIANISHEIRTPLNTIIGFAEIMKDEVSAILPKVANEYYPHIENSGTRLIRTIDLILNISRFQSGMYTPKPERVNLRDIIQELIRGFRLQAEGKYLGLNFEDYLVDPFIESDVYCVVNCISNLINNAIKYTYQGYVYIALYNDGPDLVKLEVKDTGVGIDQKYMTNIFRPFSQEDTSYTRSYEGVGLGMAITRKMLDVIGANISVTSTKKVGSTFTINFPRSFQVKEAIKTAS